MQRLVTRARVFGRLGKFLFVGGIGVGVNTAALFLLHQIAGLPVVAASALAVEVAILNNYLFNDRWTFGRRRPWPAADHIGSVGVDYRARRALSAGQPGWHRPGNELEFRGQRPLDLGR
jgi:hypothetical protein